MGFQPLFVHCKNDELNTFLGDGLRKLGPLKKVNVRVILHNKGSYYGEVVKAKTLGGKINEVTVLIGLDKDGVIQNASSFSWSKNDTENITIRNNILDVKVYNAVAIAQAILDPIAKYHEYRDIEEFQYLSDEHQPIPTWALVLLICFGVMFPFGYSYVAYRYEIA